MTTSSSIVTTLKAGSGIDMAALAQQLAVAQFAGRNQQLAKKTEVLERQISAASTIKNMMSKLVSALGERVRAGDLSPQPLVANSAVAAASVPIGQTGRGSYALEVLQLASAQTLASAPVADAASPFGAGTLTFRFGTISGSNFTQDTAHTAVEVEVADGASLTTIASAINAKQAGITAYVAQTAQGAQLVFKGSEGAANGFVVETTGDPALNVLGWNPSVGGNPAQLTSSAGNARFRLDGLEMTSPSNSTGAIAPGLQLTLRGINPGAPTQIGYSNPTSAIGAAMQDLVDALNTVLEEINTVANPLGGDLARDSATRALRASLTGLGTEILMPDAPAGAPRTLSDLGLALQRDGTFRLDNQHLQATLTRDPTGAAALFTPGLYGIYASLDRITRSATSSGNPSSLTASITRYEKMATQAAKDTAGLAEKQEALRAELSARYAKTDSKISASQATLSFLKAQIDAWNAPKR